MSIEHIFRNIWDIRVFDNISCLVSPEESCDFYDIMEILEAPEYESIQIQDSIDHLVREEILKKVIFLDYENSEGNKPIEIEKYYLASNNVTKCLISAVFENSFNTAKKIEEGNV